MKAIPKTFTFLVLIPILVFSSCATNSNNRDKSLVSWVTIDNRDVGDGSILTLQDGEVFDGIILSEKGESWIAGSEEDKRSPKDPKGSSLIAPGIGEVEQIAIVYKGNEILIYRDAVLQVRYEAENIDLLSSNTNMVVFGSSHYGGEGAVSGALEDARIYDKALSEEELKQLQPNQSSRIEPYAWWDFEGDEVRDRMGRYEFHNLGVWEDVEIKNGRLILKKDDCQLIAARTYVPETPEWPDDPPGNWPKYHLAHPGPGVAFPGDPNPAFYYKERYHLHYIYENPYGFMFAHLSSSDMVHWEWQPTVLGPPKTGHGMFSGTGFFTREGKPAMIYHGWGSDRNHIMYGLDDKLNEWTDPEVIIPRYENGDEANIDQWDPDCWQIDDNYYGLSGGEDPGLMKSDDLKNWIYLGKLLHEDYPSDLGVSRYEDISCANIFRIGEKWMLLCISHALGCRYYLGDFKDEKFLPEYHALMNWMDPDEKPTGFAPDSKTLSYFAPESVKTKDGRRVMWTWITADASPSGLQSLPRELELPDDGILRIRPLKELETLRYDEQRIENITVSKDEAFRLSDLTGDAIEMEIQFTAPLPEDFGMMLLGDERGEGGIKISAGASRNTLGIGSISPPFKLAEDEDLTLRIFIDKNLVEVFANDRQAAAYANKEIRQEPGISFFTNDRSLVIKEVTTWKMRSAYNPQTLGGSGTF
ncbi:GH32 C-terminal domain-containing protein [Bacteroidota bacterium]